MTTQYYIDNSKNLKNDNFNNVYILTNITFMLPTQYPVHTKKRVDKICQLNQFTQNSCLPVAVQQNKALSLRSRRRWAWRHGWRSEIWAFTQQIVISELKTPIKQSNVSALENVSTEMELKCIKWLTNSGQMFDKGSRHNDYKSNY